MGKRGIYLLNGQVKIVRRKTATSSFGTVGRIGHDSTKFYNGRLYRELKIKGTEDEYGENPLPKANINRVFCGDSSAMRQLPNDSVHLMVTSPPYNVGKDYDEDLTLAEYRTMLRAVFAETYRVLVRGGRVCVNVANLGRKPYIPLHAYIIEDMLALGFLMRGEILWDKGASVSPSTAWGSWLRADNPVLRDTHEYILVFCKGDFARANPEKRKSTIKRGEFLEFTKSVWKFDAERATRVGHPAPFPLKLPYRAIQLYTFAGDTVLDPFAGSGTTCLAALKSGRSYVAYDINPSYCELANRRIRSFKGGLYENQMAVVRANTGSSASDAQNM